MIRGIVLCLFMLFQYTPAGPVFSHAGGSTLVDSWPANDGSGSTFANPTDAGNPATATAVTFTTPTGFPSAAATYNGTSSFAVATNFTNTNFDGAHPFSVSTWVYSTDDANSDYRIVNTLDAAATGIPGWSLELVGANGLGQNQVAFLLSNDIGSNLIGVFTTTTMTLNAIHNVCVTYSGSKAASGVKIYIDGTLAGVSVTADSLTGSTASPVPVYLGALKNGAGVNSFKGSMGFTHIYTGIANCPAISAAGPI
jgi:Concanavalin A-like lectin/glucanases superfamily